MKPREMHSFWKLWGWMSQKHMSTHEMKAMIYDDCLDRLPSTYCTEGLIALSVR